MEADFSSDCSESFISNGKKLCEAQIGVCLSRVRPTRTARNDQVNATGKPVCTRRLKCPHLSNSLPLQLQFTRHESFSWFVSDLKPQICTNKSGTICWWLIGHNSSSPKKKIWFFNTFFTHQQYFLYLWLFFQRKTNACAKRSHINLLELPKQNTTDSLHRTKGMCWSENWRPEVQDQGASSLSFFQGLEPWLGEICILAVSLWSPPHTHWQTHTPLLSLNVQFKECQALGLKPTSLT